MAIRFSASGTDLRRTTSLPDSASFTCCGWAIRKADRGAYSTVFGMGDAASSSSAEINLSTDSDGDTFGMYSSGNPGVVVSLGVTLTNDRPFFWAIVGSATGAGGNTAYFRWIDQKTLTSQTNTAPGAFTEAIVMVGDNTYGDAWDGSIWNVMCWNRALTAREILLQSQRTKPIDYTSLNFHWPMDRHDNPRDFGPNRRDPTITGTLKTEWQPNTSRIPPRKLFKTTSSTSYTLTAAQGSYSLSGQTAGLKRGLVLVAAQGSYTWTGSAAVLDMAVTAGRGTYTLSGQAATLTYSGGGAKTITAGQGSYSLTGQSAGVKRGFTLAAGVGSYSWSGQPATVTATRRIAAAQGSYTFSGQTATFVYVKRLNAGYGSYVWNTYSVADPPGLATTPKSARFIAGINALKTR